MSTPLRIINTAAPIRLCDNGGWTDTWFAERGAVFNIAAEPCVHVQIAVYPPDTRRPPLLLRVGGEPPRSLLPGCVGDGPHRLLEAAIAELLPPDGQALEIGIGSEVPPGASTGTSAAVTVALLGGLAALRGAELSPAEAAAHAHRVETQRLGLQSGIQDQLCAAYGGINLIEMPRYPDARVLPLRLAEPVWWELDRRLVLVFLGSTHRSSDVHSQVIARLEREGSASEHLETLRRMALRSREALEAGDLAGLGQAMAANTAAQQELHPALVNDEARRAIALARDHGALGWKVNGAGGPGGSLTLLSGPLAQDRERLVRAIALASPAYQVIPVRVSRHGLRVWDSTQP